MAEWAVSFPPISFLIILTFGECLSASRGGKDRPSPGCPSLSGASKKLLELGSITAPLLGPLRCCEEGPDTFLLPQREFSILGGGKDTPQGHVNHQMSVPCTDTRGPKNKAGWPSWCRQRAEGVSLIPRKETSKMSFHLLCLQQCFSVLLQPLACLDGSWLWGGKGETRSPWHQFSGDEPLRDGVEQPSELSLQKDKETGFYSPIPITFG